MNFVRETFGNDTPVQACFMHFKINCHDYTGPTMFCQANFCTICFIVISNVFDFSSFGYLRQLHAQ